MASDTFLRDVLVGLSGPAKWIPCKYLYDARGSALFEEICALPCYYPTRTESGILAASVDRIAALLDADTRLVELGSGASAKTCILLDHAPLLSTYVPVDISTASLEQAQPRLHARYPRLQILPVAADYTQRIRLPALAHPRQRTVLFFPGSTIGNFEPAEAIDFLAKLGRLCGPAGAILVGIDTKKDPRLIHAAYNDPTGVTARFNLNVLARINRELLSDIDVDGFYHDAVYEPEPGRLEMRLVSLRSQRVEIAGHPIWFEAGEAICTEHSYKYAPGDVRQLAAQARLRVESTWTDPLRMFAVYLLRPADHTAPRA